MANTELFNKIAENYDTPDRLAVSQKVMQEVENKLPLLMNKKVLIDYGCGTGEIGLAFISEFEQVVFEDTSAKMLEIVKRKISDKGIENGTVVQIEEKGEGAAADCIIMTQVLLHIPDTKQILENLYTRLNSNGMLFLIDFDKNENIQSDLVHNGFDQEQLKVLLKSIGFQNVLGTTFYSQEKLFMNQKASLFCIIGKK